MANSLFKKTSSGTSAVKFYKKTSTGLTQCPVYRKTSTGMVRIDEEIVTKTYTVTGYADWNVCYLKSSSSATSLSKKSSDYNDVRQGKYSSYYYYTPMCFKSVFDKVKGKNITKVELTLYCDHAYYHSEGINTYVSGCTVSSSAPSTLNTSVFNDKRYSSNTHFDEDSSGTITLNSTAIADIKAGNVNGLRMIAKAGWSLTDYGYFTGTGTKRPKITVTYTEEVVV